MLATAATAGPTPGIGIFRTGTSYPAGWVRPLFVHHRRCRRCDAAGALATKSLVYMSGTSVQTAWSTGVPYSEALANGWLLKDSAGNYLRMPSGAYVGDVGIPATSSASSTWRRSWRPMATTGPSSTTWT